MNVAASAITHTVLRAEGFSCPSCVAKIEKRVGRRHPARTIHADDGGQAMIVVASDSIFRASRDGCDADH